MKRALLILTVLLTAMLSGLSSEAFILAEFDAEPEPESVETDRFPIVTRIDMARDYGFFIGDEIPLTLTIEVENDVVLDLMNLPRAGDQHGLFEIREMVLTSSTDENRITTYDVRYQLQYFGAAPLTIEFKPLEILYALGQERSSLTQMYTYKSLFTQPVIVNISRIGPYRPTQALGPKGPLDNQRMFVWQPDMLSFDVSFHGCDRHWIREDE